MFATHNAQMTPWPASQLSSAKRRPTCAVATPFIASIASTIDRKHALAGTEGTLQDQPN